MVWRWFGVVWWWFWANMAGHCNKNAFKFPLKLLILPQKKHILGDKKVVWDGLEVVWGGLEVVWGVLGWFGVFPRTPRLGILQAGAFQIFILIQLGAKL